MTVVFKCRKCRRILIDQTKTSVVNHHSIVLTELNNSLMYDCGGKTVDVWYLQETEVPEWVVNSIDEAEWKKGKLVCPQCNARIGSFDFIAGSKCSCSSHVLPSIHFVKSKIDLSIK